MKTTRVAVLGSGIAGLGAAYTLCKPGYKITLFEAEDRLGGHSNTLTVEHQGNTIAVDTGFIIYNQKTYPRLCKLFGELQIPTIATTMSFSATCASCHLCWGSANLRSVFAQRRNLFSLSHLKMLAGMGLFFRRGQADLQSISAGDGRMLSKIANLNLAAWTHDRGIPEEVLRHHIVPMGAAIWSTASEQMLEFPALTFLRFFANHGLLGYNSAPPWLTVKGGSRVYVERLAKVLVEKGVSIQLSCPVTRLSRRDTGVTLETGGREPARHVFDKVVIATHSDTALRLLADPSPEESQVLSALRYTDNETILHGDESQMPFKKDAWSSWNLFTENCRGEGPRAVCVTYHMNRLQSVVGPQLFVTLNPRKTIRPDKIYARLSYAHPRFDAAAIAAQDKVCDLQGKRHTYYAGAWLGYGFHEDGLRAGQEAAAALLSSQAK